MRFVALDLETTGVDPRKDRIVEIHMREVTWPLLHTYHATSIIVNPGVPIPPEATAVHGFSDDDVVDQPFFSDIAEDVQGYVDDSALIAYNGRRFDVPLLHHELVRAGCAGIPLNTLVIDPYEIFVRDVPRTLAGALKHYAGEVHEAAHEAAADVDAMIKVLGTQMLYHPHPEILLEASRPDRRAIDHDGCFYVGQDGVVRFNFGKHRGQPIIQHHDYLRWMLSRDFGSDVECAIRNALQRPGAAA